MKINKIKNVKNELIEQIKKMLLSSFPKAFVFKIEYFTGEEPLTNTRGLFINIVSDKYGLIYTKNQSMKSHETLYDIEEPFVNNVINDLVLIGLTILTNEAIRKQKIVEEEKAIRAENFVNVIPNGLIYTN